MIKNIKFSNFYSFSGEQEISFVSKKKETYDYFQSKSGDQITKIAGFVGGNASGKTNVMKAFSFLSHFVCKSKKDDQPNLLIAYKTFFNNRKPSKFSVEFEEKEISFFYEFTIQNNVVMKEVLSMKELKEKSIKTKLFSRELNNPITLNKKYFNGVSKKVLKNIREDVSLIAFLNANYKIEIISIVYNYFSKIKTNTNEKGILNNFAYQIESLNLYLQDKELKKKMENIIRRFDIGLDTIEIKKEVKDENIIFSIDVLHTTDETNNKLGFDYESRGTKSLFFTLSNILGGLRDNSVVIIDEIETGLHPEALNKIISYFIDENSEGNAQVIFSSHSLGFMNKFDMHQIYLVEKTEKSESSVRRLNQIKEIRSDENFMSKYMAGAYGAFPKISI